MGMTNAIRRECADGAFGAYVAKLPDGNGPGILVAQEIFGVNNVMRALCDGLADDGCFALCPDLFWRQEPDVRITDRTDAEWAGVLELHGGFDEDRGVDDLVAALPTLRGTAGCTGRAAVVSYSGDCLATKRRLLILSGPSFLPTGVHSRKLGTEGQREFRGAKTRIRRTGCR